MFNSNQNNKIYSLYTPFRNLLRKLNQIDSIYVIWCYSRNFTFNLEIPQDIELPAGFVMNDKIDNRRYYGVPEYEQEFLLKQILINCDNKHSKISIRNRERLSKIINYSRKTLSEGISKISIDGLELEEDFLIEFHRMAHRQFSWQKSFNLNIIFRYYKIYCNEELKIIIEKRFKMSPFEIFIIGFFLFRHTANTFRLPLPFKSDFDMISNEKLDVFFQNFSITTDDAKKELKESQQMNENLFYSYNPLHAKPILIFENTFICPMHLLLFWQITNGLYYSIVNELGFENAYGNAFENYIGEVLYNTINNNDIGIYPEEKYGKKEKRTTDWILLDSKAILFIECKTKRLTIGSKTELDIKKGLVRDLKKMAGFVAQVYKTYLDYRHNEYPTLKFDKTLEFIPLVLTLETWYINFNPRIMLILNNYIVSEFEREKLDQELLSKFPYHLRSCEDFEKDIQIINTVGIKKYFEMIKSNTLNDYCKDFPYVYQFAETFKETFLDPLKETYKG
ncbi:hypothetical protein KHA90_17480 [Flavobacterium psychroterrae]|uniref:NERD domain-containing protein n=1 Tax=Flavobacterium psychroterrae TaxID=2133767 RepID=A0ABS5PET1_9FLAO|nr:hypothetical protein [Flavobacterium psychroterrae]MBS7232813.1 hypothetical protein [Flavobacterium psychroterrae]